MLEELLPHNLAEFTERFGTFHDAVIHEIRLDLFSKTKPYKIVVTIGTRDWKSETGDEWINLTLEIEAVSRFYLKKEKIYDFAIIYKLNIGFFDNEIYLDFFPFNLEPTEPDDFEDIPNIEGSLFVVVGRQCFWSTSPYIERDL